MIRAAAYFVVCAIVMTAALLLSRPRVELVPIGEEFSSGDALWADAIDRHIYMVYTLNDKTLPDTAELIGPYFVWDIRGDSPIDDEYDENTEIDIARLEATSAIYQVVDGGEVIDAFYIYQSEIGTYYAGSAHRYMTDAREITGEFALINDMYIDHIVISDRGIYRDEMQFRHIKGILPDENGNFVTLFYESPFDYLDIARHYGKRMIAAAREKYPLQRYALTDVQALAETLVFETEHAPHSFAMDDPAVKPVLRAAIIEEAASRGDSYKDCRTIEGPYPVYRYEFRDGIHHITAAGAMYNYSPGTDSEFYVDLVLDGGELKPGDFSFVRAQDSAYLTRAWEKYYLYAQGQDEFWFGIACGRNGIALYNHEHNPLVRTTCGILEN
ncbi:MAG: hypothetical protein J6C52_05400 [Clostridia bacterium]|nr:hypothetical protein [Clostridia bacterium]